MTRKPKIKKAKAEANRRKEIKLFAYAEKNSKWLTPLALAVVTGMVTYRMTVITLGIPGRSKAECSRPDYDQLWPEDKVDTIPVSSTRPMGHVEDGDSYDVPVGCAAAEYFAEVPVRGLHLLCVSAEDETRLQVTIFMQSNKASIHTFDIVPHAWPVPRPVLTDPENGTGGFSFLSSRHANLMPRLRSELEQRFSIAQKTVNSWAIFTRDGTSIENMSALTAEPLALIFEGGIFVWPGIKTGHEQHVRLGVSNDAESVRTINMVTLSLQPLVFSIEDFLTTEECDFIREHAAPSMENSVVSLMDRDKGKLSSNWRTSSTFFMPSEPHPPLKAIDDRVADLSRVPKNHQELVQVLRYDENQKYDAHHDYFDPKLYKDDERTMRMTAWGEKNRMATVLWYLSDVEGGGETIFPQAGGHHPPRSMSACNQGLKVKPQRGKVIMFYSLHADGTGDAMSLHGACPVKGTQPKWAANKWIWNTPIAFGV